MENKISVIVCTYNQEKTIARTLDSILMQQCHVPYEIVIGEDCSTDGTQAVCRQYAERFPDIIRLFANSQNKGLQDNYFDCILAAHGKYIADCAGDDFWTDPQKLEKEVCIMEQHPQVSMVITNWQLFDEQSQQVHPGHQRPLPPISNGRQMLKDILTQTGMSVFHLCTSLYRTDIICSCLKADPALFRNKDYGCEDIQVAFSMALHGDIAYLPDITLNYSQGLQSISSQPDDKRQFRFVLQNTNLVRHIAQQHQIAISDFLEQRIFALYMHAFRAHSQELHHEVQALEIQWNAPKTKKTAIADMVMENKWLWVMALQLRRIFVSVKQLLH